MYTPVDTSPDIVIVYIDDWCALYRNGRSIYQGHSIRLYDLKSLLPPRTLLDSIDERWMDGTKTEAWAFDYGRLPERMDEISKIERGD